MSEQNYNKEEKQKKGDDGSKKPDGDFDWSKIIRAVFSWGAVIVIAVIFMNLMTSGSSDAPIVDYKVYQQYLDQDKVVKGVLYKKEINDYVFEAELKAEESIPVNGSYVKSKKFMTVLVESKLQKEFEKWDEKSIS